MFISDAIWTKPDIRLSALETLILLKRDPALIEKRLRHLTIRLDSNREKFRFETSGKRGVLTVFGGDIPCDRP